MAAYDVTIEVTVRVTLVGEQGEHSVQRYIDNEDGIQDSLYGPLDRDEVLAHLAYNGACNGVHDASRIDGWADLPQDVVTMSVVHSDRRPMFVDEVA